MKKSLSWICRSISGKNTLCYTCGKDFDVWESRNLCIYCSEYCFQVAQAKQGNTPTPKKVITKGNDKMRCKMKVVHTGKSEYGHTIKMMAVYGDGPSSKAFFEGTPTGSFEATVKADIGNQFEPGQEVYIDITPAGNEL